MRALGLGGMTMPIYEYHCERCGCDFERLVRSFDSAVVCPECGDESPRRKFSVFGFKSSSGFVASSGKDACASCATPTACSTCAPRK